MNVTLNSSIFDGNFTVTDPPSSNRGPPPGFPDPSGYTDAKELIWKIVPPIVILLGTFGNSLTIVVLLRQVRNLSSTAVYLLSLAFSDILILYLGPVRQWIQYIWNVDVRLLTNAGCKIQVFLTYFSVQCSSWFLVAVTIERAISVVLPHKVKLGCTTIKAAITVFIIFVCIFGLNSHFLYGYGKIYVPRNPRAPIQCVPLYDDYLKFRDDILPWIDFVVTFLLPFCILTVGNILIIVKLKINTRRRKRMSMMTKEKGGRSVTLMLIALCAIFFICLTPISVFLIILPYLREDAMQRPFIEMVRQMEYLLFWHAITNCFGYINASTNFILYFLSGSRFRSEVRNLFTCKRAGLEGVFGNSTSGRSTSFTNTGSSSVGGSKTSPVRANKKQEEDPEGNEKVNGTFQNEAFENKNTDFTSKEEKSKEIFTNIMKDDDLNKEENHLNSNVDITPD